MVKRANDIQLFLLTYCFFFFESIILSPIYLFIITNFSQAGSANVNRVLLSRSSASVASVVSENAAGNSFIFSMSADPSVSETAH